MNFRRSGFLVVPVMLSLLSPIASAQQPQQVHHHEPVTYAIIDGRTNPELISDAIAYHLVFIHIANILADPTAPLGQGQAIFSDIGLTEKDQQQFITVLSGYRTQHNLAVAAHNLKVENAMAARTVPPSFVPERDLQTQITRDLLKSSLSPSGMQAIDVYVQNEKKNMKVTRP